MSSRPPNPRHAYCEDDYSEDAHTTLPESRQTANIAAKRSRPEISKLKLADTRDERSDSGNSSQTAATLNSGDSSLESKAGAKPLKLDPRDPASKKRPTPASRKSEHRLPSPPKSTPKPHSSKARDVRSKKTEPCKCSVCKAEARKSLTLETSWPAAVNRQVPPKREVPNTPQSARPPLPRPTQDVPVPQPAPPRPRAATAQGSRAPRPMSYHGGYVQPQSQAQPMSFQRRAQTPYNISPLAYPPPSFPPNRGSYFPAPQAPTPRRQDSFPFPSSPYDLQPRPQTRTWNTEHPSHRHSMIYTSPPVIEYPSQPQPQYISRPPSAQPQHRPSHFYCDPSPPPLENTFSHDEDFYRMPPPPPPPPIAKLQQRPTMRHAATTSTAHPMLHHHHGRRIEDNKDQGSGQRSPRKEQAGEYTGSRRPSLTSRPSATPSSDKSNAHLLEHGIARMSIDGNEAAVKRRRRASYYGRETPHNIERVAESYQDDVRTTADALPVPITSELVRKKTHSDTGSRASAEGRGSRDGSDVKPRNSTDRRGGSDVKSRDDGVTMRFNPASGVNLNVTGGSTEGRIISFRQSREAQGEMELSIGAKRNSISRTASRNEGRERHTKTYPSARAAGGLREVEVARNPSRMRGGEREPGRNRTRSVAPSSRRSSKSGYSGRGEGFF